MLTHDTPRVACGLTTHLPSGAVAGLRLILSEEAHDGWRALAQRLGMTQAAMFEMLGRYVTYEQIHPDVIRKVEEEGRALAAERARKGGPKPKKKPARKPRS